MNKNYSILILLFFALVLFLSLNFRGGWIEQDSYAFLSRACGTSEFETPILAKNFFDSIPCNQTIWFVIQTIIWTTTIGLIILAIRKDYPTKNILFIGLSLSTIYSILAIEDDFLLTGILMIGAISLLKNPTIKERILFLLLIIIGGLFFWKGIFLIGSIFLLASIKPKLSIIPVLAYFYMNGLNGWQNSVEGTIFGGGVILLPIIFVLFSSEKNRIKKFFEEKPRIAWSFISLTILGYYQIKWGLYSGLLLPIVMSELVLPEKINSLLIVSTIILFLSIPALALIKPPTIDHWSVLEEAKKVESLGGKVYIDQSFGFEKWGYEYVGGHPLVDGRPDKDFYYLGVSPPFNCSILAQADDLFLKKC